MVSRKKRLFALAESLIRELDGIDDPIQPEDLLPWLNINVPQTDAEAEQDYAEQDYAEHKDQRTQAGRGRFGKLRELLNMQGGDLLDVLDRAIEICAMNKPGEQS